MCQFFIKSQEVFEFWIAFQLNYKILPLLLKIGFDKDIMGFQRSLVEKHQKAFFKLP